MRLLTPSRIAPWYRATAKAPGRGALSRGDHIEGNRYWEVGRYCRLRAPATIIVSTKLVLVARHCISDVRERAHAAAPLVEIELVQLGKTIQVSLSDDSAETRVILDAIPALSGDDPEREYERCG